MKTIIAYLLSTLMIVAFILGAGSEPLPTTSIYGIILFKSSMAVIVIAIAKVMQWNNLFSLLYHDKSL
ncbi:MAG: hypothetical protein RRY02_09850 [Muribaculaceae bacterium]